jgi:AraC-like DNA-binding protein
MRSVRDRIDRSFAEPLNIDALASGVHMSSGHLSRRFRDAFGESPYSYLMTRRIERAATLLRRSDTTITEVCFTVGFSSLGTFTTRFTECYGLSPGRYRRQAQSESGLVPCIESQVLRPIRNREARRGSSLLPSLP